MEKRDKKWKGGTRNRKAGATRDRKEELGIDRRG